MKTTKLTRRYLLTQVKKLILEEPKRLDMHTLLETDRLYGPSCGTVGCIAGWTLIASKRRKPTPEVVSSIPRAFRLKQAARLLHLTFPQENRLFFLDHWPARLIRAYESATTSEEIARVTCKRIDLFLKSGGKK